MPAHLPEGAVVEQRRNQRKSRKHSRTCPWCGIGDLHRVRRKPLDRLVSLIIPIARYRCDTCYKSGLRRRKHRA
jgi:hypothetical protein